MKHPTLYSLGLCALAAAGGASAQSSVTLFGVMDASISRYLVRSESWDGGPSRSVTQSMTGVSPSGNLASRIGIRATEDLGGGLSAGMWLEAPVTNDTGGSSLNFGRRSTLSLASSKLGELRLGRDHTPSFMNDWAFDPFTSNGVGLSLISVVGSNLAIERALATKSTGSLTDRLLGGGLSAGTDNYLRTSNAVAYHLPKDLGGVYGFATYAFPENTTARGRYVGARLGWAGGPADVAMGYGISTLGNASAATGAEKIKSFNLGGSYNFGIAKVMGEWSDVRNVRNDAQTQAGISDRYRGLLAGVTIPVGPHMVRASWARVQFRNGQGLGDSSVNKLALGYVHNLSKRTALYTTVSRISVSNGQNNPAVMGVTPRVVSSSLIQPQPNYVTTGGMRPDGAIGFDVGLRMTF